MVEEGWERGAYHCGKKVCAGTGGAKGGRLRQQQGAPSYGGKGDGDDDGREAGSRWARPGCDQAKLPRRRPWHTWYNNYIQL